MSTRETLPAVVSDLRLERYRLGELPPDERQALAAGIAADPELQRRLALLEASSRDIQSAFEPQEMARRIRMRARLDERPATRPERRRRPWLAPASVVATCVCVAAVGASLWLGRPAGEDTTIKGGEPALVLHRRLSQSSEELASGAVARQGDQIRIGYRAASRPYGAILSVDGRGVVTQHLPRAGERAAELQPSGTVFLDFSYELDDAPRWEVFYLVTADAAFDLEPVRSALRAAASAGRVPAALVLPRGFAQAAFPVMKDDRR
jgi:anti-sigma factor RsiW